MWQPSQTKDRWEYRHQSKPHLTIGTMLMPYPLRCIVLQKQIPEWSREWIPSNSIPKQSHSIDLTEMNEKPSSHVLDTEVELNSRVAWRELDFSPSRCSRRQPKMILPSDNCFWPGEKSLLQPQTAISPSREATRHQESHELRINYNFVEYELTYWNLWDPRT